MTTDQTRTQPPNDGFTRISYGFIDAPEISGEAKVVAAVIAALQGAGVLTHAQIAERLGCERKRVLRNVHELVAAGIVKMRRRRYGIEYDLTYDAAGAVALPRSHDE